jgi:heterodisulfide reductase subunit A-like polyferredoxin
MAKQLRDFEVYLVYVDKEKCEACHECTKICPTDVFDVQEKCDPVRPENCLGCGTCVAVCKSNAIVLTEI